MGAKCGIVDAEFNECTHSMLIHKYRIAIECSSGKFSAIEFLRVARMSAIISQFTCKWMCGDVCVRVSLYPNSI